MTTSRLWSSNFRSDIRQGNRREVIKPWADIPQELSYSWTSVEILDDMWSSSKQNAHLLSFLNLISWRWYLLGNSLGTSLKWNGWSLVSLFVCYGTAYTYLQSMIESNSWLCPGPSPSLSSFCYLSSSCISINTSSLVQRSTGLSLQSTWRFCRSWRPLAPFLYKKTWRVGWCIFAHINNWLSSIEQMSQYCTCIAVSWLVMYQSHKNRIIWSCLVVLNHSCPESKVVYNEL